EQRAGQRGDVHVVDVDADAGLEGRVEVGGADAADVGGDGRAEHGALLLQRDAGRLVGDLGDVRLAAGFHQLRGDGGDRERRVLQVLLPELRGDDDFVQRLDLFGRERRAGGSRDARRDGGADGL